MATQRGQASLTLVTAPKSPFLSTDLTWQAACGSGGTSRQPCSFFSSVAHQSIGRGVGNEGEKGL